MKNLVVCLVVFLSFLQVSAQKIYTLEECIDIAIKNSLLTQRAALDVLDANTDLIQAKQSKLPNVDLSLRHGLNFGRNIDPSTNDFINEQITRGSIFSGASVPLWQAGRLNHSIKQYQYAEEASRWALKNEQDNLRLQVTLAYLQVLSNQELAIRLKTQEGLTASQLLRLEDMDKNGAAIPSQLADMKGQQASDQLSILDANQQVNNAKLALSQLMNVPFDISMQIASDRDAGAILSNSSEKTTLNEAIGKHPMIRSFEFSSQSAQFFIRSLKASRFPMLSFGADLGTNYSSNNKIQGKVVNYVKQGSNNLNYAVGLSIYLPIMNNYQLRGNIRRAETFLQRSDLSLNQSKNLIQQRIEEAWLFQRNSAEKYNVLVNQVTAFKESFRIAEVRFNQGVLNSVEYLIVKNNLDRAENQLISAKYELAFRNKVIDFYAGLK